MTKPTKRKIERLEISPDGLYGDTCKWCECGMGEIKKGDIFRMLEPGPEPGQWAPFTEGGGAVVMALEDASLLEGRTDGSHGVACEYVNGFDAMTWT